ncbi:PadR family transcriptional regulator [Kribbella sp. NPDC023855]|uniref:PadR family transcriptional regulator n=1 Tax=Kribbella sp. NPDC023855 TaxID=3154698 RepID=UPI0033F54827
MAERRTATTVLALGVMSALLEGPMPPYEVARLLRARHQDGFLPGGTGTLYNVFQDLTKRGSLEVVGTFRPGARPARTVYRITDAGCRELHQGLHDLITVPVKEFPRLRAGLVMLSSLHPDEATELLRTRLLALQRSVGVRRNALERRCAGEPRQFLLADEYDVAIHEAEAAWITFALEQLLSSASQG